MTSSRATPWGTLLILFFLVTTSWADQQLVFGSFRNEQNAYNWITRTGPALDVEFAVTESMTDAGRRYRVVTPSLGAEAAAQLRVVADARALNYWQLPEEKTPRAVQQVALKYPTGSATPPPQRTGKTSTPPSQRLFATSSPAGAAADTSAALFTDDDLLLFAASMDGHELSGALAAYSSRAGLYFPLGELARLLDLAIVVDSPARRADGWFLSPDRHFLLDLPTGRASSDGKNVAVSDTQATFHRDELYVRADLLQGLLPLTLKINKSDLSVNFIPLEQFPFQVRQVREARQLSMRSGQSVEDIVRIPGSYEWFSPPSVDASFGSGYGGSDQGRQSPWDLRLGGDVAYTGMQLFAGSDTQGDLTNVRTLFERKDPDGKTAGPLGATRSNAGDVYTPSLPLGMASKGGRGVMMTSSPLDQASVFSTTDVRGELPLGYTAELYLNNVLRGSQSQPVRGNYEFLDIPLTYGVNLVRLVFYGPRGERSEEVRRINVGSGQLQAGRAIFSAGIAEEGIPLFDINDVADNTAGNSGLGTSRMVGSFAYGLSNAITLTAGIGQHTPNSTFSNAERRLLSGGLLSSVAGFGVAINAANDNLGGRAYSGSLGGRVFDVSLLARHSEYSGNFVDEHQYRDLFALSPLSSSSELTADWSLPFPFLELALPMSVRTQQSQFVDGADRLVVESRVSAAVRRYLLSTSWQFEDYRPATGESRRSTYGTIDASTLVWDRWQIRAAARFSALPATQLDAASILFDGMLTERKSLRFGVLRQFGATPVTRLQAGTNWLLPKHNISLSAEYAIETKEARVLLHMAFSSVFDPLSNRYRAVRPGAAAGGNVVLQAFVDANGDGVRQSDEEPVPGITAQAGIWPATSGADGTLLLTGLGDSAYARIHVDPGTIPDPYLTAPANVMEITPRPGEVRIVNYPLRITGEAAFRLMFNQPGQSPRGLSAVQVQLVSDTGEVVAEGRSEFDGILILDRLPTGSYSVRIDPDQSERLQLKLAQPVALTISPQGGYLGEIAVDVMRIN